MLQAVSLAGIVFMLIGVMDPRARPFVALIALAWLETAISSAVLTGDDMWDARWMMRVPIDLTAGALAVWMTRDCEARGQRAPFWMASVPSFFIIMLMAHGVFWWPAWDGKQFFGIYAHTLNVLWLLQLAILATPGGGNLVGIAGTWYRNMRDGWSRIAGVGVGKAVRAHWQAFVGKPNRRSDERPNRGLQISASE